MSYKTSKTVLNFDKHVNCSQVCLDLTSEILEEGRSNGDETRLSNMDKESLCKFDEIAQKVLKFFIRLSHWKKNDVTMYFRCLKKKPWLVTIQWMPFTPSWSLQEIIWRTAKGMYYSKHRLIDMYRIHRLIFRCHMHN